MSAHDMSTTFHTRFLSSVATSDFDVEKLPSVPSSELWEHLASIAESLSIYVSRDHLVGHESFLRDVCVSADECRESLHALSHEHLLDATGDLLASAVHAVRLNSVQPLIEDVANWLQTLEELNARGAGGEIVAARERVERGDVMSPDEALEFLKS